MSDEKPPAIDDELKRELLAKKEERDRAAEEKRKEFEAKKAFLEQNLPTEKKEE